MKRRTLLTSFWVLAVILVGGLTAASGQGKSTSQSKSTNLPNGKARGWKVGQTPTAQLNLVSPLQPVAFWSFNRCGLDGSVILDSAPSRTDLDLAGVVCANGKYGLGAYFNGVDAIGETDPGVLNFSNKLTISAWVYPDTVEGPQTIVNKWYAYDSYMLSIQDGYFVFTAAFLGGPWGTTIDVKAPATAGQWTHVTGVYDGDNHLASIYLNGFLRVSSYIFNQNGGKLQQSLRPVAVGSHPSWNAFRGRIDEIGIYDAVLTPSQIRNLAGSDVGPYHGADSNVHPETDEYPVGSAEGYDFYAGQIGQDVRPCNIQDMNHRDVLTGQPIAAPVCQFSYEAATIARPERTYGYWHLKGPQHGLAGSYGSPLAFGEAQADAFIAQWRRYRHLIGGFTLFADVERDTTPPEDSGWEVCVPPSGPRNSAACEQNGDVLEGFLERVSTYVIDIEPGVYTRPNIWTEFFSEDFIPMNGGGEKLPFALWLTGCGGWDSAVYVRTPDQIAADLAVVQQSALGGMKPVVWQHQINHPADYDAMTQNPSGKLLAVPDLFDVFVLSCP